jgi:sterol desaturase/sphingolipid hydroxylase (fatty acid hydroxylase superfamily)
MELNHGALMFAFPVLVLFAVLEALYLSFIRKQRYEWRESAASLGVAIGGRLIGVLMSGIVVLFSQEVWQYSCFTLPVQHPLYWPVLFMLVEFIYYWFHRISHTYRWFWATHAVHHTPNKFYLSGAYRLGWTGQLTGGFIFFAPLFILGFNPASVFLVLGLNLLYQFWLHTELIGTLHWFDRLFNSPSNHRVHHSTHTAYLDKNFGGVLMLYDHLFGTYAAEEKAKPITRYGVLPAIASCNPIKIALHEWARIVAELKARAGLKNRLNILFGRL